MNNHELQALLHDCPSLLQLVMPKGALSVWRELEPAQKTRGLGPRTRARALPERAYRGPDQPSLLGSPSAGMIMLAAGLR
jgi:hypothetical protein